MKNWKKVVGLCILLSSSVYAQDKLLLIPVDENSETGFVIDNVSFDEASKEIFVKLDQEQKDRDLEKNLDGDFQDSGLTSYINDHLTIEGQVTAFVMALGARGAVGHRFFNDHLEVGVDVGALLLMAGKGKFSPEVGTYIKARLNPEDSVTYYFKGRLYKAWGLADNISTTIDYGFGAEVKNGGFYELTIKHYKREGKSDLVMPFFTFGYRFAGPKTSEKKDSFLFSDEN